MSLIESKLRNFFERIISNTQLSDRELSFYRIFLGIFFLIFRPEYRWLGDVPAGFYKPNVLSLAKLFDHLPEAIYFEISDISIIVLLITVILGIKARLSFSLLFILTVINNSFAYSFGKIDHSIFYSLIFLLFAFTNSGTKYGLWPDKKIRTQEHALAIFAICLVFAFFTAGFEKAGNWIDFNLETSGILAWFYQGYFNLQRDALLAEYFFNAPPLLYEIMDYTAVLFEFSGILSLYHSRRSWILYLILASFFHLTNTLILNISFNTQFIVYGIWLLSPFLLRNKWIGIILFAALFLKGLNLSIFLWGYIILFSVIFLKKYSYPNKTKISV